MLKTKGLVCFLIMLMVGITRVEATPDIFVGNVYDFLLSDEISFSKSISNNGDTTAFIKIAVKEINFGKDGKVIEGTDIDVNHIDERLVVSPNRLIVPANGSRSSRVMFTGSRDVEKYFRVTYVPVLPTREDGFDEQNKINNEVGLAAGFNVLIGYGTLVYVAPEKVRYETNFNSDKNGIKIINNGNASIKLSFLVTCDNNKKCSEPATIIVRPGKTIFYDKNKASSVSFTLIEGKLEQRKIFQL